MKDALGDRMKAYEGAEAQRRFMPLLPIMARIDGRSFSSFTHGMERPFDDRFSRCMIETTLKLVQATGASVGYSQSDEISLCFYSDDIQSQVFFDGRIQRMTSQLAALATLFFYREVLSVMPEYADRLPSFDARVWSVPNLAEAANTFLWREVDATKNSVSMAARHYFSHGELHCKNAPEMKTMLESKGIIWGQYPAHFKRGTFVRKEYHELPLSLPELEELPEKHHARTDPDFKRLRSVMVQSNMEPIGKMLNVVDVLFHQKNPITKS